jgi:hypothetical protein
LALKAEVTGTCGKTSEIENVASAPRKSELGHRTAAIPMLCTNVELGMPEIAIGEGLARQLHISGNFTFGRVFLAWRHGDSSYKPGGKVIGAVPVS